jgi:hypothetical protein
MSANQLVEYTLQYVVLSLQTLFEMTVSMFNAQLKRFDVLQTDSLNSLPSFLTAYTIIIKDSVLLTALSITYKFHCFLDYSNSVTLVPFNTSTFLEDKATFVFIDPPHNFFCFSKQEAYSRALLVMTEPSGPIQQKAGWTPGLQDVTART